jgi:cyclase
MHAAHVLTTLVIALGMALDAQGASPWKSSGGFSMDWANVKVEATQLAPHLYMLQGSGGNVGALVGAEGTLLADGEFAPMGPKLEAKLAELGAGPVRMVINTHYHSDHTGTNGYFIRKGAIVIAQENCRADLLVSHYSPYWRSHSPAVPESEAPSITYRSRMTFYFGGEEVIAIHNQPAHTDGDTVVFFKTSNVVHMGDVFVNLLYPYIDVAANGTIDGYFPVIDEVLAMIDDHTQVIPGHGPVATKSQLKAYRDMLKVVRDRVAAGMANGESMEAIMKSNPSREFDPEWASDRVGPDDITAMIYFSLKGTRVDWGR